MTALVGSEEARLCGILVLIRAERIASCFFFRPAAAQDQSGPAQSQDLEPTCPRAGIVQLRRDARSMNQQEGDKKDRSQQSCCDSRLFPEDDCCANGYEDDAGQIGPEGPSRKKWRAQTGSEMGIDEMLNPKSHKRPGINAGTSPATKPPYMKC